MAVEHYLSHGRCLAGTLRALGYPGRGTLADWIDELHPEARKRVVGKAGGAPRPRELKQTAVIELCTREASARVVAQNAGVSRPTLYNWKNQLLPAKAPSPKRGRPLVYTDALIQGLLGLKQVFHLPLRALQGFAQRLRPLAFPTLQVPNYKTLSRRAQSLNVVLPASRTGEPLHLMIDSTGLKLYGEGERKVRKHGWSKRRTWRKVHLAMDANSGQICAALMTHQDVGDDEVLADLLDQIPADTRIDTIGGDGAYDSKPCHAEIAARGAQRSNPPRDGAKPWSEKCAARSLA